MRGGRLRVADEAYAAIVLPACTVLEGETARRLEEFAADGGRLVAVGALPSRGVGGRPGDGREDLAVARLRARLEALPNAGFVGSPGELGPVLAGLSRVDAPVPALVREFDGATVVFLTAVFPRASEVSVGRPDERGVELGWLDASCDFDPARYATEMRVRVHGVEGAPLLVSPFGGPPRPLRWVRNGDATEVVVPFDDGPAALVVFPSGDAAPPGPVPPEREAYVALDLGGPWEMELVPTLDNTWGDFARPAGRRLGVERWALRHRAEPQGVDGVRDGWATADPDEAEWDLAHATFGPHGVLAAPADPRWCPVIYSSSRGIHKDPVHRDTLGPKGHVPEEFLDLGDVRAGDAVRYRTAMVLPEAVEATLAVGAAAAKQAWLDGVELALDDRGHLATTPVRLGAGTHLLDLWLVPDEDLRLRAHVALVRDAGRYRRPEWIAATGPSRPGARVTLGTTVVLDDVPVRAVLQVAAVRSCRVRINGVEAGRQGGFDPYADHEVPRVRRYDVAGALHVGDNDLVLELTEGDAPAAVLADGDFGTATGPSWRAARDGEPVAVTVRRRQHGDPAALHLWRRPHPLPGAAWLEDAGSGDDVLPVVFAVPDARPDRVEWFRFDIPPGATRMEFAAYGTVTVFVGGARRATTVPETPGESARVTLDLSETVPPGRRTGALRVEVTAGFEGGAVLSGPIRFEVGTGRIDPGDWEQAGLAEYSGGVLYRRRIELPLGAVRPGDRMMLDLGRVRGTAEVIVNGRSAGVRVCSPYRFEVTPALRDGRNEIEVVVFGTLAPYLDAVSPTHFVFPGQRTSGLIGPVRLISAASDRSGIEKREPRSHA